MTRQRLSLRPPPADSRGLADFPRSPLGPATPLWRVVSKDNGPWWFSSTRRGANSEHSLSGRFDLPEPEGTCYLAAEQLTAVLEVFGPDRSGGMIAAEELARRRVYRLRLPQRCSLADLTSRRAAGFGLTLEVHSSTRYDLTQAWALSLRATGATGLLYLARHDPSSGECVALFGPSGEKVDWDRGQEEKLDEPQLVEQLWQQCRIRIIDRPRTDQIPVLD